MTASRLGPTLALGSSKVLIYMPASVKTPSLESVSNASMWIGHSGHPVIFKVTLPFARADLFCQCEGPHVTF